MAKISVLNGPNLNLLGEREPQTYGLTTLDDINQNLSSLAEKEQHQLHTFQSNAEHALIDRIQQATKDHVDFIIINPAALTHTSIALRDALLAVNIPFIEVHLSNIFAREPFRQHSYLSDIAQGVVSGLGPYGYQVAFLAACEYLKS